MTGELSAKPQKHPGQPLFLTRELAVTWLPLPSPCNGLWGFLLRHSVVGAHYLPPPPTRQSIPMPGSDGYLKLLPHVDSQCVSSHFPDVIFILLCSAAAPALFWNIITILYGQHHPPQDWIPWRVRASGRTRQKQTAVSTPPIRAGRLWEITRPLRVHVLICTMG